jgi:Troponin
LLLRKKAAEELKKEQERKAAERRRIIEQRCGKPKNIADANEGKYTCSFCSPFSNISHVFIAHLMEGREVMNASPLSPDFHFDR